MHTIITTGSPQTVTSRGIGVRRRSLSIDAGSREVLLDDRAVDLTRTEFDLLHVLSKNPRQVFTPRQLFHTVWSSEYFDADHVIETHISRLRRKLGESGSQPRYIHTVRGVGYRFEPDPEPREPSSSNHTPRSSESGALWARLSPDLAVTQIDSTLAELVGIPDADCLGRPFPELVEPLATSRLVRFETEPLRDGYGRLIGQLVRVLPGEDSRELG